MRHLEAILGELGGFLDIGSTALANAALRELLDHSDLNAEAFGEALRAAGMRDRPEQWRDRLEAAYRRMPARERKAARRHMLAYYSAVWDAQAALPFTNPADLQTPSDIMFAMDVLLHAGELTRAKRLARVIERQSFDDLGEFDTAMLIASLASYYARVRDWEHALNLWSLLGAGDAGMPNVAASVTEIHIARALDTAAKELDRIGELKRDSTRDTDLALSLPGIEDDVFDSTEKELTRVKRGLERVLRPARRIALGLAVPYG